MIKLMARLIIAETIIVNIQVIIAMMRIIIMVVIAEIGIGIVDSACVCRFVSV